MARVDVGRARLSPSDRKTAGELLAAWQRHGGQLSGEQWRLLSALGKKIPK